jgi:hypothetical protein
MICRASTTPVPGDKNCPARFANKLDLVNESKNASKIEGIEASIHPLAVRIDYFFRGYFLAGLFRNHNSYPISKRGCGGIGVMSVGVAAKIDVAATIPTSLG